MMSTSLNSSPTLTEISTPQLILQAALAALSEGRISEVVEQFDDHFTFADHALALEVADRERLTEFLHKSRELFPDTVVEVGSIFECGDYAIAEWKLSATHTVPYGSISYRSRILLPGTTIIQTKNGRIRRWSDYYDQSTSRRVSLAAFFTEWIEY
jgi:SnoaL-like domain